MDTFSKYQQKALTIKATFSGAQKELSMLNAKNHAGVSDEATSLVLTLPLPSPTPTQHDLENLVSATPLSLINALPQTSQMPLLFAPLKFSATGNLKYLKKRKRKPQTCTKCGHFYKTGHFVSLHRSSGCSVPEEEKQPQEEREAGWCSCAPCQEIIRELGIEQPGSSQRPRLESSITTTSTSQPQTSGVPCPLPAHSDTLRMLYTCTRCLHIKYRVPEFHHHFKNPEACSFQRIGETQKDHFEQCSACRAHITTLNSVQLPASSSIVTSTVAPILQKITYSTRTFADIITYLQTNTTAAQTEVRLSAPPQAVPLPLI
jgi:hypothetical protein